jgi:hypothetical protein
MTLQSDRVALMAKRLERALTFHTETPAAEAAQSALSKALTDLPRRLYGSETWCQEREFLLRNFEQRIARIHSSEAA